MKSLSTARIRVYLFLFAVLLSVVVTWLYSLDYPEHASGWLFPPLIILMLIGCGFVLLILPAASRLWERDDLFERATRRGFIASAAGPWEQNPDTEYQWRRIPPLRRLISPDQLMLSPSYFALLCATYLVILWAPTCAVFALANTLTPWGLRVYLAGPSGYKIPVIEQAHERLAIRVTSKTQWFLDDKLVTREELEKALGGGPFWPTDRKVRKNYKMNWYLNSKLMTEEEVQRAIREAFSRARLPYVYLDVDRTAPFEVATAAIEVIQQVPGARVVLVTEERDK